MKVSEETWKEKMDNLNKRRAKETIKNSVPGVDNYKGHLSNIEVGKRVLDIGAGSGAIWHCLNADHSYTGIDPFPQSEFVLQYTLDQFFQKVEPGLKFDTIIMFAALDNVQDFKETIDQIKCLCNKNVLFLTGVNIEPDQYHTIKITEEQLTAEMAPFKVGFKKYLHPKILLIEYQK